MSDMKMGKPFDLSTSSSFDRPFEEPSDSPLNSSRFAADKEMPNAIIGPKIRFKGELAGEEDLTIQGYVEGTIDLKHHRLTIGKEGSLKADVFAKTIIVEGRVEGDLHGDERVAIRKTSDVRGNIVAERVCLEDGAKFRGSIDMDVDAKRPNATQKAVKQTEHSETNVAASTPLSDTEHARKIAQQKKS